MKRAVVIVLILFVVIISQVKETHAQQFSTGIYPPVIQATAIPPAIVETQITLTNQTETEQQYDIIFKPFRPSSLYNGTVTYPASTSLPEYLFFPRFRILDGEEEIKRVTLEGLESKNLTLEMRVNEEDSHGDYYFSLIFLSPGTAQEETSQSVIPAGIATNVLLSIGPKGPALGTVEKFETKMLIQEGPVPFTILFKNPGERLVTPTGKIIIRNMFGQEVDSVDILPEYVLAHSARYLTDTTQASYSAQMSETLHEIGSMHSIAIWAEKSLFGRYTAELQLKLLEDQNKNAIVATTTFVAIPILYVAGILFGIIVTIIVYLRVRRKM